MYSREVFWKQTKKTRAAKCQTLVFPVVLLDALGGIRTPGRRGTGNHRSIQLSYERILTYFLCVMITSA